MNAAYENRESTKDMLSELVRFALDVARGVTQLNERDGRALIDRVVESGKISREEGEELYSMLTSRMARNRERFEKRVKEAVERAVEELSSISNRELDHLRLKTEEMERRLASLGG